MHYKLKLQGGKTLDLAFSVYFLNRVCKLTGKGLSNIFPTLLGDMSQFGEGVVSGGMLDDLELRAAVLAAAWEADGFANKDYTKRETPEGFEIMEAVDGGLASPQWAEIYSILTQCLVATLPKDEVKKKAVKKPATKKAPAKK